MFLGQRGADAENLPRASHHVNRVSREIPSKYSGTPLIRPPLGQNISVVITGWSY